MTAALYRSASAKKLANRVGVGLLILSLFFIVSYILRNWTAIESVRLRNSSLLALASLVYAVSHVSTALSWPIILRGAGKPIPWSVGIRTGLIAQAGKYLPGNVAHYVGRAAIATKAGIPLADSGFSTLVELLAAPFAAMAVISIALVVDPAPLAFVHHQLAHVASAATGLTLILLAGLAAAAVFVARKGYRPQALLGSTACLATSFLLAGLSCDLVVSSITAGPPTASMIAIFVLAWFAGFIVPGAPAGLGIREAILFTFLSPVLGAGNAIACSLIHRLITAGVDGGAALAGYAWLFLSKKKKSANDVLAKSRMSSG